MNDLSSYWQTLTGIFQWGGEGISNLWTLTFNGLVETWNDVSTGIIGAASTFGVDLTGIWQSISQSIGSTISTITGWLQTFKESIQSAITWASQFTSLSGLFGLTESIPGINLVDQAIQQITTSTVAIAPAAATATNEIKKTGEAVKLVNNEAKQIPAAMTAGAEGTKKLTKEQREAQRAAEALKDAIAGAGNDILDAFGKGPQDEIRDLSEELITFIKLGDDKGLMAFFENFKKSEESVKLFTSALQEANREQEKLKELGKEVSGEIDNAFGKGTEQKTSLLASQLGDLLKSGDESGVRILRESWSDTTENVETYQDALREARREQEKLAKSGSKILNSLGDGFSDLTQALGMDGRSSSQLFEGLSSLPWGQWFGSAQSWWNGGAATNSSSGQGGSSGGFGGLWNGLSSWFGGGSSTTSETGIQVVSSADQMGPHQDPAKYNTGGGWSGNWGALLTGFGEALALSQDGKSRTKKEEAMEYRHLIGKTALNWLFPGIGNLAESLQKIPALKPIFKLMDKISPTKWLIDATMGENIDTTNRKLGERWIEKRLLENSGLLQMQGADGKYRDWDKNIIRGESDRFNQPGWRDESVKKFGEATQATFDGLAVALGTLSGQSSEVFGQMGVILSETLNGNLDNARTMVQSLGISLEEMESKLVTAGLQGSMSWLQVESALQAVHGAFGRGRVAVGDLAGAIEQLRGSAGMGTSALKGVRDMAIEAMELGDKSLDAFKKRLLASGQLTQQEVDGLMQSLAMRGITSLEQLADASDRTAGGIVADLTAQGFKWDEVTQQVNQTVEALSKIPDESVKNIQFNVSANLTDEARQVLDSQGVKLSSGGSSEAVAEQAKYARLMTQSAYSSLKASRSMAASNEIMRNSRSSSEGKNLVVNVDARGAGPGVGQEVYRAMEQVKAEILGDVYDVVMDQMDRRGF